MNGRAVALAVTACALMLACPQQTAVWVSDDSTPERLVFQVASSLRGHSPISFDSLDVWKCSIVPTFSAPRTGFSWSIWRLNTVTFAGKVIYGVVPDGFHEDHAAEPLAAGCYRVRINGTGTVTLDVTPEGKVLSW